jgi:phosphoglycolate phosphatase-like HAD superfamily hydrolase
LDNIPLLVFDFDGVLVDGMVEYWWAARGTALRLAPQLGLPEAIPDGFRALRPRIHKGWEMVLMAAELARPDLDLTALLADYDQGLQAALVRWGWSAEQLQLELERFRAIGIDRSRDSWLARHRFYPGVPERRRAFAAVGVAWMVLTTKGTAFARELLGAAGLEPAALYGHEAGSKPEVLARLLHGHPGPIWFVEDRRPTLEAVRALPALAAVRCFLVSWGYLGPSDGCDLPAGISWLTPEAFAAPLAAWP